jgi:large subunit ribosomal protein L23
MSIRSSAVPKQDTAVNEGRLVQVLLTPVVSEKINVLGDQTNTVAFRVLQDATKSEIKAAVELFFKVQVKAVNVLNQKGKAKRSGRFIGRRNNVRKAYVTLGDGQKLNLMEGDM